MVEGSTLLYFPRSMEVATVTKQQLLSALGLKSTQISAQDIILSNGRTAQQEMEYLARVAMGLLAKHINAAYKAGQPAVYHRTYGAYRAALNYDMSVSVQGARIVARCRMPDSMMHPSLFSPGSADTLALMDRGYTWRHTPPRGHIPYFTQRPAGHIIENTLREFMSVSTPLEGVRLEIHIGD